MKPISIQLLINLGVENPIYIIVHRGLYLTQHSSLLIPHVNIDVRRKLEQNICRLLFNKIRMYITNPVMNKLWENNNIWRDV